MARPSQNTDQRLVDSALEMLPKSGISGLKLRDVAEKAGVNLGMFHYHFKTKEAFTRRVLQELYEKFFREFSLETAKDGPPLEKLRAALTAFGKFALGNRRMALGIFRDVASKDRLALDFVKSNIPRHGEVILGLVRQCQKEGSLKKLPLSTAMPFLMGGVALPAMVLAMLEHLEVKAIHFIPVALIKRELASEKAIGARVDLALSALAPAKGGGR
jgi:AcrR family transcriptional regulator